MSAASPGELLERLSSEVAGARRLAVIELGRLTERDASSRPLIVRAAIRRLAQERDEKAALGLVRLVATHARSAGLAGEAAAALTAMYDDDSTPAVVAVEAMRAAGALTD
ncbi:MAG: hypothetical protein ACF8QF_01350 [Phycisphaerales bacterium]